VWVGTGRFGRGYTVVTAQAAVATRSAMADRTTTAERKPILDQTLVTRLEELIQGHPTHGYRRLWALLRFRDGLHVNRKAVYRVLKLKVYMQTAGRCIGRDIQTA
jgi:putative transposase